MGCAPEVRCWTSAAALLRGVGLCWSRTVTSLRGSCSGYQCRKCATQPTSQGTLCPNLDLCVRMRMRAYVCAAHVLQMRQKREERALLFLMRTVAEASAQGLLRMSIKWQQTKCACAACNMHVGHACVRGAKHAMKKQEMFTHHPSRKVHGRTSRLPKQRSVRNTTPRVPQKGF